MKLLRTNRTRIRAKHLWTSLAMLGVIFLPAIALGYYATPAMMRLTRTGMLEVLESDYIRTARAKGLRTGSVIFKHALRNAIIPVVALAAVELGFMLGGSVVIESVFSLNGLGLLGFESVINRDYPVVFGTLFIFTLIGLLLKLVSDLTYMWVDPRIDFERRQS